MTSFQTHNMRTVITLGFFFVIINYCSDELLELVICTLSKKMEHGIVPVSYLARGTFLFNKVEDLVHLKGLRGGG